MIPVTEESDMHHSDWFCSRYKVANKGGYLERLICEFLCKNEGRRMALAEERAKGRPTHAVSEIATYMSHASMKTSDLTAADCGPGSIGCSTTSDAEKLNEIGTVTWG